MIHVSNPLPFNGSKKAEAVLFESLRRAASAALTIYFTRDGMSIIGESLSSFQHPQALASRDAAFFAYCCQYMKVAESDKVDLNHDSVAALVLGSQAPRYLVEEVSACMQMTFEAMGLDGPAAVSRVLKRHFGEYMIGETDLNYAAWRTRNARTHNSFLYELLFVNIIDTLTPVVKSSPRILGAADLLHVTSNMEGGLRHLRENLFPEHLHPSIPSNTLFRIPDSHALQDRVAARAEYAVFRDDVISRHTFAPPVDLVVALAEDASVSRTGPGRSRLSAA